MDDKDIERDVKEYKPKKRNSKKRRLPDNDNVSPAASAAQLLSGGRLDDDINDLTGGVMLTTSEIIDFSEGADSWTGKH